VVEATMQRIRSEDRPLQEQEASVELPVRDHQKSDGRKTWFNLGGDRLNVLDITAAHFCRPVGMAVAAGSET
jgi:hypothetical protein